jgi:hypothetical protein
MHYRTLNSHIHLLLFVAYIIIWNCKKEVHLGGEVELCKMHHAMKIYEGVEA